MAGLCIQVLPVEDLFPSQSPSHITLNYFPLLAREKTQKEKWTWFLALLVWLPTFSHEHPLLLLTSVAIRLIILVSKPFWNTWPWLAHCSACHSFVQAKEFQISCSFGYRIRLGGSSVCVCDFQLPHKQQDTVANFSITWGLFTFI